MKRLKAEMCVSLSVSDKGSQRACRRVTGLKAVGGVCSITGWSWQS